MLVPSRVCTECKQVYVPTGGRQRFCIPCGKIHKKKQDKVRGIRYYKKDPERVDAVKRAWLQKKRLSKTFRDKRVRKTRSWRLKVRRKAKLNLEDLKPLAEIKLN